MEFMEILDVPRSNLWGKSSFPERPLQKRTPLTFERHCANKTSCSGWLGKMVAEAGEEAAVRTMEGGEEEEQGPFAANGSKPNPEDEDELEEARKVVGEDGVSYETLEDAEAGNKIQAVCPMVVASREVKEKKKVISFATKGLKDVYLWIDIFGFAVLDSHGKVTRSVPYPMLASWMIDNDLFQVQLVNKKGKQKKYKALG